jgi:hypothetical protein
MYVLNGSNSVVKLTVYEKRYDFWVYYSVYLLLRYSVSNKQNIFCLHIKKKVHVYCLELHANHS